MCGSSVVIVVVSIATVAICKDKKGGQLPKKKNKIKKSK